jgi:competence protein ComEA
MKQVVAAVFISLTLGSLPSYAVSHHHSPKTPEKSVLALQEKIDLNKADLAQLVGAMKGIGQKRAEAIIAYREEHHGFKSIEELAAVKGIGQHFFDAHKDELIAIFVVQ